MILRGGQGGEVQETLLSTQFISIGPNSPLFPVIHCGTLVLQHLLCTCASYESLLRRSLCGIGGLESWGQQDPYHTSVHFVPNGDTHVTTTTKR